MDDVTQLEHTVLVAEIRRVRAELDSNPGADATRYQTLTEEFARRSGTTFTTTMAREAGRGLQSMDDPAFLAERRRVRETLEALTERMRDLDEEFTRRASLAWTGGDPA